MNQIVPLVSLNTSSSNSILETDAVEDDMVDIHGWQVFKNLTNRARKLEIPNIKQIQELGESQAVTEILKLVQDPGSNYDEMKVFDDIQAQEATNELKAATTQQEISEYINSHQGKTKKVVVEYRQKFLQPLFGVESLDQVSSLPAFKGVDANIEIVYFNH